MQSCYAGQTNTDPPGHHVTFNRVSFRIFLGGRNVDACNRDIHARIGALTRVFQIMNMFKDKKHQIQL